MQAEFNQGTSTTISRFSYCNGGMKPTSSKKNKNKKIIIKRRIKSENFSSERPGIFNSWSKEKKEKEMSWGLIYDDGNMSQARAAHHLPSVPAWCPSPRSSQ